MKSEIKHQYLLDISCGVLPILYLWAILNAPYLIFYIKKYADLKTIITT